jgi:hypothetical protein
MPLPNFHAARLRSPGLFVRIRRIGESDNGAVRIIGGPLKSAPGGPAVIQAFRFDEEKFTPAAARKWLEEHDHTPTLFEEATKADEADPLIAEDEALRLDRSPFGRVQKREDGSMFADAVVTRAGIFKYRQPDGNIRSEFRPADEVFHASSIESAKMLPVTDGHPNGAIFVTPANAKSLAVGFTGENVRRDGDNVVAPIKISTEDGIKAVNAGRNQLSLGYKCRVVRQDGVHRGQPYTHVQTRIRYNHLALVEQARAGSEASLRLDAADAVMVEEEPKRRQTMPESTVRLDNGIDYDAAPEVAVAFESLTKERGELQAKLDSATAERDKAAGERDELKTKLDEATQVDHSEAIRKGVKERIELEGVAKRVLAEEAVKKLDSMSNDDIVVEVIKARHKDFDVAGKSAEYLRARFDSIAEGLPDEQATKNAGALGGDGSHSRRTDGEEMRTKAIERMAARSRGVAEK